MSPSRTFLVLGACHSGTSTLSGLINQFPEALSFFEVDFSELRVGKYRSRYEPFFPKWDYLFGPTVGVDWSLRELSHQTPPVFNWVGSKIPELRHDLLNAEVDRKFCTVRDPLSWVSHPSTFQDYGLAAGFMHAMCDYVLFIDAAISSGAIMFSLERLYLEPQSWRDLLYRELPGLTPGPTEWWNSMDHDQHEIKVASNWLAAHRTSTRSPEDFRPLIKIRPGTVIGEILEIFATMNTADSPVALKKIHRDRLEAIRRKPNMRVEQLADTEDSALRRLLDPLPPKVALHDRVYSKFFGRHSRLRFPR
jgi:hypothetical protein